MERETQTSLKKLTDNATKRVAQAKQFLEMDPPAIPSAINNLEVALHQLRNAQTVINLNAQT